LLWLLSHVLPVLPWLPRLLPCVEQKEDWSSNPSNCSFAFKTT
jgi:hypothetical protein